MLIFFTFVLLLAPGKIPSILSEVLKVKSKDHIYVHIFVAGLISISCTTSSSISLEGENIWILQTAPLSKKQIVDSKLALNITIHTVGLILSTMACLFRLHWRGAEAIVFLYTGVSYSLFTSIQGIYWNLRFPKFHWDYEVVVIKQSLPVFITGILNLLPVASPVVLHFLFHIPLVNTLWVVNTILLPFSLFLYKKALDLKI
ncbi:MAG: hypothetical protein Q4P25_06220 [Tissierellia bacterium]|nr:hypothetical protein [Tissierellia bacterium]